MRSSRGRRFYLSVALGVVALAATDCRKAKTSLRSEPSGAEVHDAQGKALGRTPVQLEVPTGGHSYRLTHPDFAPATASLKPEDKDINIKLVTRLEARGARAYYLNSEWMIYDKLQGDFRYRETVWIAADEKMTIKSPEDQSASAVRWEILGGSVWRVGTDPETRLDFVLHNKKEDRFFSRGGEYYIERKK